MKDFGNSERHDWRENKLGTGKGKVVMHGVGTSLWVDEDAVCAQVVLAEKAWWALPSSSGSC